MTRGAASPGGLAEVAGQLARDSTDLSLRADEALVQAVRSLDAAQRSVDAARIALIGELDARNEPVRRTGLVTGAWLGHEFGLARPVIGKWVSTARCLRSDLPLVATALKDGVLTLDHASLLSRLCTPRVSEIVIALQPDLIALADGVRFE